MTEAQETVDSGKNLLTSIRDTWNQFTGFIEQIPGITGSIGDVVGGLIVAGLIAITGFAASRLLNS